jgi:hypothetical protein
VQQNSSAFFGDLQPGDVMIAGDGASLLGTYPGARIADLIARHKVGDTLRMTIEYPVSDSPLGHPQSAARSIQLANPGAGAWITQVGQHTFQKRQPLPRLDVARTDAKQQYESLRRESYGRVISGACSLGPADIRKIASDLKTAGDRANIGTEDDVFWEQVRANACANSKDGGLPPFEAALQAMTDARNLDRSIPRLLAVIQRSAVHVVQLAR